MNIKRKNEILKTKTVMGICPNCKRAVYNYKDLCDAVRLKKCKECINIDRPVDVLSIEEIRKEISRIEPQREYYDRISFELEQRYVGLQKRLAS